MFLARCRIVLGVSNDLSGVGIASLRSWTRGRRQHTIVRLIVALIDGANIFGEDLSLSDIRTCRADEINPAPG